MLIGYNNDVQYRGKTFHIQTEDRGEPALQIETQIFHAGAILDTRIVSYEEIFNNAENKSVRNRNIKTLMQTTHRELYRNLLSGEYNEFVGLEEVRAEPEVSEVEDRLEDFTPSQDRVPGAMAQLEEEGADAFDIDEGGDHVDISSLKDRLASMGEEVEAKELDGFEEKDEDIPTQVMTDLDEIPQIVQNDKPKAKSAESGVKKPALSFAKSKPRAKPAQNGLTLPETGRKAWTGCQPASRDLSLVELVEAFLQN